MKIWILNNYNMLPEHGALTRAYYFGKCLKKLGHEPVVFVGSHPHNTNLQLIKGNKKYLKYENCDFSWVLVKTCNYEGSKLKRVFSMFQYYLNVKKAVQHYEKPDAIIGSSAHPLAAVAAIKLAKKYHCKGIVEIRDLWPESIVAYGVLEKENPLVMLLYRLEKWIYTKSDAIIFTMEGGKDYIVEKKWDTAQGGPVDLAKVYHVNNGVDLEEFNYHAEHSEFVDEDLESKDIFKVVYAGSIRLVNQIDKLVDVAVALRDSKINNVRILIWGNGDQAKNIDNAIKANGLTNIKLKGHVAKKDIPTILRKSDLNIYILADSPLYRFGLSMNKSFEYFASGKPVLASKNSGYSIIEKYKCGVCLDVFTAKEMADTIARFAEMPQSEYSQYCDNALHAAQAYDFMTLTQKLIDIIINLSA